jgi:hypothetical protein
MYLGGGIPGRGLRVAFGETIGRFAIPEEYLKVVVCNSTKFTYLMIRQ